ncbi:hypothetical protein FA15DRAFT_663423 [Coprinopsis marcescibilis]|uniref:Uncharacterized protein n=1 Tax=Coprinopsis marcescibilis TaxID=230819 RepID=A0A5C3LAH9_COPMA|nr:hypothetical protein FA15DRAFT_663423 [Coprinopsis marcescibilis]
MAGSATAVCTSTDRWSFNSRDQSPCFVATQLAGACVGGDFRLPPLGEGFVYLGPNREVVNACRCSSVYYSVLSACAECQGRNWVTWTDYNDNCTAVNLQQFPAQIPTGVSVPQWAYLDVSVDDTFDVSLAQAARGPEATGGTSPNLPGGGSGGSQVNAGAIAGGVIGGVAGLALIGLLIFFILRQKKKNKTPPSAQYAASQPESTSIPPYTPPPMSYGNTGDGSTYPSANPAKVYDPNDPSTWPSNSFSPSPQNTGNQSSNHGAFPVNSNPGYVPQVNTGHSGSTGYASNPHTTYTQPNQPTGRYTGVAEI